MSHAILIVFGVLSALATIVNFALHDRIATNLPNAPAWASQGVLAMGTLGLFAVAALVGLWFWRRWALYLYVTNLPRSRDLLRLNCGPIGGVRWSWLAALLLFAGVARAQDNYEIQVYGSETVAPGMTMVELHSNVTAQGERHAVRETLELTRGFNGWLETGFYVFTTAGSGQGWSYVGSHIRPRVRVPLEWHWPVGVSLSTEIGYVRPRYAADTWSWEVRPIFDKTLGRWYLAFNPALEKSLHGANAGRGFEFAPALNVKFDVTPKVAAGIEYYGGLGPLSHFDPLAAQGHQIYPSIDLNLSPDWEFNAGIGFGLTRATDRAIVKFIVGRRLH